MDVPIPDSYRVTEGLLAGEYPGARDPSVAALRLRAFEAFGITHFVDLTHSDDALEPYESVLVPPARRIAYPIVDLGTVTSARMTCILDELDEALGAGGSVYLHCWGGIGRTGIVVGCWLLRHDRDAGDVLARVAALRANVGDAHRPSPETDVQRELVEAWIPGR